MARAAGGGAPQAGALLRGAPRGAARAQAARHVALSPRRAIRAGRAADAGPSHTGRHLPAPLTPQRPACTAATLLELRLLIATAMLAVAAWPWLLFAVRIA